MLRTQTEASEAWYTLGFCCEYVLGSLHLPRERQLQGDWRKRIPDLFRTRGLGEIIKERPMHTATLRVVWLEGVTMHTSSIREGGN